MTDIELLRGGYVYLLNGQPAPVEETWLRRRTGDDCWEIKSSRLAGDVSIHVQAVSNDRGVKRCRIQWRLQRSLEAQYEMLEQHLRFSMVEDDQAGSVQELPLGFDTASLFPLMRIFSGPVISRLLAGRGDGLVVLPEIGVPEDDDALLRPRFSRRQARVLDEQMLDVPGAGELACVCCQYLGDQYDDSARFWLSPDNLLVRYTWRQSQEHAWDVSLRLDEVS